MLQPVLAQLSTKRIILASGSPRRREILNNIGLKFEVLPSDFEETLDKSSFSSPQEYVVENARRKAIDVKEHLSKEDLPDLIVGADTVVALDGNILEKPKDAKTAFEMLSSLSGRTHSVHTGVALVTSYNQAGQVKTNVSTFSEDTEVTFGSLTPDMINGYIETGEPLDKAGGYGIQALGGTFVKGISGDYFNVVGFPLHHFCMHQRCFNQSPRQFMKQCNMSLSSELLTHRAYALRYRASKVCEGLRLYRYTIPSWILVKGY